MTIKSFLFSVIFVSLGSCTFAQDSYDPHPLETMNDPRDLFLEDFIQHLKSEDSLNQATPLQLDAQKTYHLEHLDTDVEKIALPEIDVEECPAPTPNAVAKICNDLKTPKIDESEFSRGMNYHRSLWEMACASPEKDTTAEGRRKVREYWNKHKKEIRCPATGLNATDDLSLAKAAVDSTSTKFVGELAIAYQVDFNFIDERDGMTVLDFIQKRIDQNNSLVPKPEQILMELESAKRAVIRAGGKHAKDLLMEMQVPRSLEQLNK